MSAPIKAAMALKEIADREGTTIGALNMLLGRALRKLRRQGLILTCRELANDLDRNRATENVLRRTARGR